MNSESISMNRISGPYEGLRPDGMRKPGPQEPILINEGTFFRLMDAVGEVTDSYDMYNEPDEPAAYYIEAIDSALFEWAKSEDPHYDPHPERFCVELSQTTSEVITTGWNALGWFIASESPLLTKEGRCKAALEVLHLVKQAVPLTAEKWKAVKVLLDREQQEVAS